MSGQGRVACHSVELWLPRTMTWLYGLVTGLEGWTSWVVSARALNTEEFPFERHFAQRERLRLPVYAAERLLRMHPLRRLGFPDARDRFVRQLRPTVLHSHFGTTAAADVPLARGLEAPHVASFYGYDLEPRRRRLYAPLFATADAVVCEGPHMAGVLESLGCPAERIRIFHLGVDLERIEFRAPSREDGSPLRILMAGWFVEKKGFAYALDAVAELIRRRPRQPVAVTVVGASDRRAKSRRERRRIEAAVERGGLRERVTFTGSLSHDALLRLAGSHDLFLSPSVTASDGDTEGGAPVAILEMAAAGLPVVSTTHCDIPHVLGPRNRELLVPERDVEALADRLEWWLDHPEAWPPTARENRAHVEAGFDRRDQGRELAALYEELL